MANRHSGKRGQDPFAVNGPERASHKRVLSPFPGRAASTDKDEPMNRPIRRLVFGMVWLVGPAVLAVAGWASAGLAATPESPEVQEAVAKAVKFLESDRANDHRLGARALVGMALFKNGAEASHPKIVEAVQAIKQAVAGLKPVEKNDAGQPIRVDPPGEGNAQPIDIYSAGLSIIFLCTIDPSQYGSEIQALLDYLQTVQKDNGGWGYPSGAHAATGDTSMTQYGALSAWEATQVGFRVPTESIERLMIWLLKTQDPTGQYGYQGTVSDTFKPVAQKDTKPSMTAAGMGSLYICADLLGLIERVRRRDDDLPPALKEVKDEDQNAQKAKTKIDPAVVQGALSRGDRWMGAHPTVDPPHWTYYYLYALERYQSFREEAAGKIQKEPRWYNDGVRFLIKGQKEDGSWKSNAGEVPDTAFGVLFLLRSMKKSIERARNYGAGTLVGGRGLPKETSRVEVRKGKVVPKMLLGSADKLLAALDDPDDPAYAKAIDALAALGPKQAETLAAKHRRKLQDLAADESPEARIAAVRALAATGDLDNVPTLIYALGDPEPAVMQQARDGLRRTSRKFDGFGLPDNPTQIRRDEVIEKWKAWYRSIRPNAEFED